MPKPAQLACQTCRTTETHNPLTKAQKVWLRTKIEEQYVEHYFMCVKERADGTVCRNLRTYGNWKRFRDPLRMPDALK